MFLNIKVRLQLISALLELDHDQLGMDKNDMSFKVDKVFCMTTSQISI